MSTEHARLQLQTFVGSSLDIGAWLSRLCARRLGDNGSSSFVDLEATAGWLHAATTQRLLHLG